MCPPFYTTNRSVRSEAVTHKILITDNLSSQGLARLENAEDIEFDIITGLSQEALARSKAAR